MLNRLILAPVVAMFVCSSIVAQEPASPGKEHAMLKDDVGVWEVKMKMWMEDPNGEPVEAVGTETNKLIQGGFWLESKFVAEMFGQKFEGGGVYGYDPAKEKYVGTWTDSMSPFLSTIEGVYDAETKTYTYVTTGTDPMTQKPSKGKMVVVIHDDNHRTMTAYSAVPDSDKLVRTMEMKYSRKK